jgi:hemoglobin
MRFALSIVVTAMLSFAVFSPAAAADGGTLYLRLGAESGVATIANTLIDRVVTDPRTSRSFKDSNLALVKKHLAQQLCDLTGGGCTYEGDTMREVHAGHAISEAEFYAMVEALEAILRERGVATADRNALLAKLAPMKRDVVNVQASETR